MSSTATLPTEAARVHVRLTQDHLRLALATAVLALIWISLRPFEAEYIRSGEAVQAGRLINQLGYSAMAAAVLATIVSLVDRRVVGAFVGVPWIAMLAIVAASALTGDPGESVWRSVLFSLIAAGLAGSVALLPASLRDFDRAIAIAAIALLATCYAGLLVFPDAAVHQAGEFEAEHAGLWRGTFTHKNIAGPVMVMVGFAGIYLMRRGRLGAGALIAALAFAFMVQAGSKTSLALAPVVVAIVLVPALAGLRPLAVVASLAAIAGTHMLTLGSVFVPAFDTVLTSIVADVTFTGRTAIWDFAGDYVLSRPWTGFGYEGFWRTPLLLDTEQPFDRSWDPRGIIHGHNGFMDVVLFFGLPGLALMVWLVAIAPAIDYARSGHSRDNAILADLFYMIAVFSVLTAALESFYFRRADPIWLTTLVALGGLRLTARLPMRGD
ncbi:MULTISPECIES: O-antigen ligase [unclassified Roseitalea]|uniref:O-antigen ligase family protein n=1 Tax=unclassified Roseitalea TaxID=2639107 RepID=UPI00273D90C0|nr:MULTISPECIES: O-antigen ligase [unclassified Roseitalea]